MDRPDRQSSASSDVMRDLNLRGGEWSAPLANAHSRQQMDSVREAFRLRRMARNECRLHALYDEHSMFHEAREARREMMRLLYSARSCWRLALGHKP